MLACFIFIWEKSLLKQSCQFYLLLHWARVADIHTSDDKFYSLPCFSGSLIFTFLLFPKEGSWKGKCNGESTQLDGRYPMEPKKCWSRCHQFRVVDWKWLLKAVYPYCVEQYIAMLCKLEIFQDRFFLVLSPELTSMPILGKVCQNDFWLDREMALFFWSKREVEIGGFALLLAYILRWFNSELQQTALPRWGLWRSQSSYWKPLCVLMSRKNLRLISFDLHLACT